MSIEIRAIGKGYLLRARQRFPRSRQVVFPFFADALNLETITPDSLHFKVRTSCPIVMQEGQRINYRLRLHGLPFNWQSEITAWEPNVRFIDEQRRGPYRYWINEHRFLDDDHGTLMIDEVRYGLFGGILLNRPFVAPNLRAIFAFRAAKLTEIFPAAG